MRRHVEHGDFGFTPVNGGGAGGGHLHGHGYSEADGIASKVGEVFKEMDIRGDGEVCWEDFSAVSTSDDEEKRLDSCFTRAPLCASTQTPKEKWTMPRTPHIYDDVQRGRE